MKPPFSYGFPMVSPIHSSWPCQVPTTFDGMFLFNAAVMGRWDFNLGLGKSWEDLGKLWENPEKTIGKGWKRWEIRKLNEDFEWENDEGLWKLSHARIFDCGHDWGNSHDCKLWSHCWVQGDTKMPRNSHGDRVVKPTGVQFLMGSLCAH